MRRIGVLSLDAREDFGGDAAIAEVERELRSLGFGVGTNLVIEWQFANEHARDPDRLAAELVRKRVEIIVTQTTTAVLAAQRATREIPIVFIGVGDPVGSGIAASLARPGRNATGTAAHGPELVRKRFDLLMKIVPKMTRVAYLFMADNPFYVGSTRHLEKAAKEVGVEVLALPLRSSDDIEPAFIAMKRKRVDAAVWSVDGFLSSLAPLGALTLKHRMPAIGATERFARSGGLMSYSPDYKEESRLAFSYVAKILRGARPGELPILQSTHFELVVNMKIARSLGITIPQEILYRADVVIE